MFRPRGGAILGLPGLGGRRSGAVAAPTNSVAPVASGTVTIGGTLTTTDGTWTGSPTFTYAWRRDGVAIGGATASTYTPVAADISPLIAIDCEVTGTNAGGVAAANSNDLSFAPDTIFPASAIGVTVSGLTLADTDTTVDQWAAAYGGLKAQAVLAAPAATNRPTYAATGGPGSRPRVEFDGVDNVLRDTAVTAGGTWGGFQIDIVGHLVGAETSSDRLISYVNVSLGCDATPHLRCATSGAGGAVSVSTTTWTTTPRQGSFVWDGANQSVLINNAAAEDTDAATPTAYADGGGLALGGTAGGASCTNLMCLGWAVTRSATGDALTTSQRADLRAMFQNMCGVA